MRLRVEYVYDPESRNWGFSVPALSIVGGGNTREEAERHALEAIEFAVEAMNDAPGEEHVEVSYLEMTIHQPVRR